MTPTDPSPAPTSGIVELVGQVTGHDHGPPPAPPAGTWDGLADAIVQLGAVTSAVVIVVGALAALHRVFVLPTLRRLITSTVTGELEAIRGHLATELADLRVQVHPNGGSSMRDAMDRVEESVTAIRSKQRQMLDRQDRFEVALRAAGVLAPDDAGPAA